MLDQWNLFGVSYGTELGQMVLRIDPGGVRSAVLDSVVSPPPMSWGGTAFGLVWQDSRFAGGDVFFANIGEDSDGDGLSDTEESTLGTSPANWDSDGDLDLVVGNTYYEANRVYGNAGNGLSLTRPMQIILTLE